MLPVWKGSDWLTNYNLLHFLTVPPGFESDSVFARAHTALVGREAELSRLADLRAPDAAVALVTGPGGVGKSRLASEAAHLWLRKHPEGRLLDVALQPATDLEAALRRIASALSLALAPGEDAVERIGDAFGGYGEVVVLMDDAERVAAELSPALVHWLRVAPDVRFWITSRRELPASVPHVRLEIPPLTEEDALRLLSERARAVRPDFAIPNAHIEDARALVRRLDALPLAIELMAPRLRLLSIPQLLARCDRGAAGAALESAVERSWDLLAPFEQAALAQSAVFVDGFYLEDAEAVIDLRTYAGAPDLLTVLETLAAHSLLRVTTLPELPNVVRVRHLASVQTFALARLQGREAVEARHAQHFCTQAQRWDAGIESRDERACTARLIVELPNIEAAFERSRAASALQIRLGLLLHMAYQRSGPFTGQAALCDGLIERAAALGDDALQAQARLCRARVARWAGDEDGALRQLSQARALSGDDAVVRAGCLRNEAACHFRSGDVDAAGRSIAAAVQAAEQSGRQSDRINALNGVGYLWTVRGDHDRARDALEQALRLARSAEIPGLIALVTSSLARLALEQDRLEEAAAHCDEAIERYAALRYLRQLALEYLTRARVRALLDVPGAREDAERAIEMTSELGLRAAHTRATAWHGCLAFFKGDDPRAHGLLARALGEDLGGERASWLAYDGAARVGLGDQEGARACFEAIDRMHARDGGAAPPGSVIALLRCFAMGADEATLAAEFDKPMDGEHGPGHLGQAAERRRLTEVLRARLSGAGGRVSRPARIVLELSTDGRHFRVASGVPVDLTRRRALRGILQGLAEQHTTHPGQALELDAVLEAGWPGERMNADSGARRVYVTMNRLRKLGLGELVLTMGDGYMLAPEVEIVRP
ncbi:MAG: hypothetical protein OXR73_11255 [Myxococcales bacterium]|nr:hypothetical protein [Myxococcales bacterium]